MGKVRYDKYYQEMAVAKLGGITLLSLLCLFLSILKPTECANAKVKSQLCLIRRWRICKHNAGSSSRQRDSHAILVVPESAIEDYVHEDEIISNKAHREDIPNAKTKAEKIKKRYSDAAEFYIETRDSPITLLPQEMKNISLPKIPLLLDPKELVVQKDTLTRSKWKGISNEEEDEKAEKSPKVVDGDKRLFLLEVGVLPLAGKMTTFKLSLDQ